MEALEAKTLNLYPIDYPFETLVNRIAAKEPKLILDPEFQRKYKWDKDGWERSSKFIESCLMRIPLPSCYFAEDKDGRHLVIDGVQRLTTIVKFVNNEFPLQGMTAFRELEGKYFREIGEFKAELEATTIRCIVLRKENPQKLVREIFSRLNQGAVRLSNQEIRHALYPGLFNDMLSRLAELPEIKNFGKGPSSEVGRDSREADEQVLRYFALSGDLEMYKDNLSKFLDGYMEEKSGIEKNRVDELEGQFKKSLRNCIEVFGGDVFIDTSKEKRRQSVVYYDLLMPSLGAYSLAEVKRSKAKIVKAFNELCKDKRFQKTLSGGLQSKAAIVARRGIWERILSKNLK